MKKIVLGLSLLGGLTVAQAQIPNAPSEPRKGVQCEKCNHHKKGESGGNHLERMKTELNLSDKQVKQIQSLHEKQREERKQAMAQQKAKFEQKREEHKKEMKKILNADQYKKWEEQLDKRKADHKERQENKGQKRQKND